MLERMSGRNGRRKLQSHLKAKDQEELALFANNLTF